MMQSRHRYRYGANHARYGGVGAWDPFSVNPIRRSLTSFLVSASIVILPPAFLDADTASLILVAVGWLAAIIMVMSFPVLVISLIEEGWGRLSRRIHPSIDELDINPRIHNLLRRHGYDTIASVDRATDVTLLMLSNFDMRALGEVRRAINIWKYRRWQEAGFPHPGPDAVI
jgi:hypothetical protein